MKKTHDPLVKSVGSRIRQLRTERGLSPAEFGRRTGIHPAHLTAIEEGKHAASTRTLDVIAVVLGTTSADLLNGDDDLGAVIDMLRAQPERVAEIKEHITKRVVN